MGDYESLEDIVLRHSGRGMNLLRRYIERDYIAAAARGLLRQRRGNVLLATGFYVNGIGETDGPPGTVVLAEALRRLGFTPAVLTDECCRGFFEDQGLAVEYMDLTGGPEEVGRVLSSWQPSAMIAIERCGVNIRDDYENMRGISIKSHTAPVDQVFEEARRLGIFTIGIGDGGNEIGMGCLREKIRKYLDIVPCRVDTDALIIASVSNWGAYGLTAQLESLTGMQLMMPWEEVAAFLSEITKRGSVDGVLGRPACSVDGFGIETEREILCALDELVSRGQAGKGSEITCPSIQN